MLVVLFFMLVVCWSAKLARPLCLMRELVMAFYDWMVFNFAASQENSTRQHLGNLRYSDISLL